MFRLTVVFGPAPATTWGFIFKERVKAEESNAQLAALSDIDGDRKIEIADDFGQSGTISLPIHGHLVEDLDQAVESSAVLAAQQWLSQRRAEAIVSEKVKSDPVLRGQMDEARRQQNMARIMQGAPTFAGNMPS